MIYSYLNSDYPFRTKTLYWLKVVISILINHGIYYDGSLTGKPITYYYLSLTSTYWEDSIYDSEASS